MSSIRLIHEKPYLDYMQDPDRAPWAGGGMWPTKWVRCRNAGEGTFVAAYRKFFTVEKECTICVHVSADERYELFVDGVLVGRGSERGDKYNWYFETYDLTLAPGEHVVTARVCSLKRYKPSAQMSVNHGFIFSPEGEEFIKLLGTGVAEWEAKVLKGYTFVPFNWVATGAKLHINGHEFPWNFERGEGDGWQPVISCDSGYWSSHNLILDNTHVLRPAVLPPQLEKRKVAGEVRFVENLESMDKTELRSIDRKNDIPVEHAKWDNLLKENPTVVEPKMIKRIIIDLGDYYCMYPCLEVSGGKDSLVRLYWSEALYEKDENGMLVKGKRDIIDGRFFRGLGDEFVADGGENRSFDTLWWQSGRYLELVIHTQEEALTVKKIKFFETRYPMVMESKFACDDDRLEKIRDICFRTLQMCAHETYMDCPYYEQLMYVGDTRLQSLITYASVLDPKLPRKAVETFAHSAFNPTGLVKCAYPEDGGKVIPSFCLWWIGMIYDYALWRGEKDFIRNLMPSAWGIVNRYISHRDADGLLCNPEGWNFYDWANNGENRLYNDNKHWSYGVPGHNSSSVNGIFNWHMVLTLKYLKTLEEYLGEKELAGRADRLAKELTQSIVWKFWNAEKKLFADDVDHQMYSEHSQCLALLSDTLDESYTQPLKKAMEAPESLIGTSIYFSHYSLEVLYALNSEEAFVKRLAVWNTLIEEDLKTTPEVFSEETRSDCHAWGAHPLYHMYASILGIRPASMGFETVQIRPSLLDLKHVKGTLVHPKGAIDAEFTREGSYLSAIITLPEGLYGTFIYKDKSIELKPGKQEFKI